MTENIRKNSGITDAEEAGLNAAKEGTDNVSRYGLHNLHKFTEQPFLIY